MSPHSARSRVTHAPTSPAAPSTTTRGRGCLTPTAAIKNRLAKAGSAGSRGAHRFCWSYRLQVQSSGNDLSVHQVRFSQHGTDVWPLAADSHLCTTCSAPHAWLSPIQPLCRLGRSVERRARAPLRRSRLRCESSRALHRRRGTASSARTIGGRFTGRTSVVIRCDSLIADTLCRCLRYSLGWRMQAWVRDRPV